MLTSKEAPRAIVFMDEIEKALAGVGKDSSGTKDEMAGIFLQWSQDAGVDGMIAIGPPGAAKSAIAKAAGNEAGIPTIAFDLSAMQGSLVGESGGNLRAALKVVDAISGGRVLMIATCNSIGALTPEIRRRFTQGTFFFDLPDSEEREAIWNIYLVKYGIAPDSVRPKDDGWTGAEIKECCRKAYNLNLTLVEAAEYIVPVAMSAADVIDALRKSASGKFISASHPGVYTSSSKMTPVAGPGGRVIRDLVEQIQ